MPAVVIEPQTNTLTTTETMLQVLNNMTGNTITQNTLSQIQYAISVHQNTFGNVIEGVLSSHITLPHVAATTGGGVTVTSPGLYVTGNPSSGPLYVSGTVDGSGVINLCFNHTASTSNTISNFNLTGSTIASGEWLTPEKQHEWYKHQRRTLLRNFLRNGYRQHIRTGIGFKVREPISPSAETRELKARATLRDMLSERDWRSYVTNGFIMVRGASGKWYQIHRSSFHGVKVYEGGKQTASLCIHTTNECPPTDHVITIKTLIEIDEQEVYRRSNVTNLQAGGGYNLGAPNEINFLEYSRSLKLA